MWIGYIHSMVDLKPWNRTQLQCRPWEFLLCLAELRARGHERPVTTFKLLAFLLQILCCDYWMKSFMVWVLLCVESYIASVVVGLSLWLEDCTCLNPVTIHHSFCLRILESFSCFFLCRGDFKASSLSGWCQYDLVWPSLRSFHSNLQQVKSYL